MKHKLLLAAIALATTNAYALDGVVTDDSGKAVAGAKVEAIDSKEVVVTDSEGRFVFASDVDELHITAPGFGHKIVHLHDTDEKNLVITLATSVIEQTDVIGLPIHASAVESALPVSVLAGDELRKQQAATLGDSLEGLPGVASSFHGNVASTPVIRGLSGPRVLITQNSLDVSDVSRVGPDHSVAAEVSTAQQVEILRGPATLFYGSGAIGGVVNVVDFRVPVDTETKGEFMASYDTVNSQKLGSFNATTGHENWAIYADGFWRDSDDYEVPVAPELEDEHDDEEEEHSDEKVVANSDEESSGFTLGGSYLMDNGYVGLAVERLDREYGIPGHSHDDERVFAELEQDRYQLQSEYLFDSGWIHSINTRAAYTDYTHTEFEDGVAGTTFENETTELRFDVFHQEWDHWKGGINIQYKQSEFGAEGEEAFTPPSTTESFAFAVMEERHFGDVLIQLGARAERVTIEADNVLLPALEVIGGDADDDHDHEDEVTRVFAVEHEFEPISASLGAVWDFTPGYNIGIAVSHAQRAPSAAELLSFGPHIGTGTYEIGALFEIHDEDGESHFELSDAEIDLETSNNIDLTFRKHEGDLGLILNLFYNQVDNYYYQQATGLVTEFSHDHEEEGDDAHDHDDEESEEDLLPVFLYTFDDAEFYGLEAQVIWQVNSYWKATFLSDFVHAELNDGGNLPRTTPMRVGADLDFSRGPLNVNLHWMHYAEQDDVAELETSTDGYDMVDASISYRLPLASADLNLFVKAENITDTEARVHTSFIKDVAPLPGRNFSMGIRGSF